MPDADVIADDRLEMMFACAHPALPIEAQVALSLSSPDRACRRPRSRTRSWSASGRCGNGCSGPNSGCGGSAPRCCRPSTDLRDAAAGRPACRLPDVQRGVRGARGGRAGPRGHARRGAAARPAAGRPDAGRSRGGGPARPHAAARRPARRPRGRAGIRRAAPTRTGPAGTGPRSPRASRWPTGRRERAGSGPVPAPGGDRRLSRQRADRRRDRLVADLAAVRRARAAGLVRVGDPLPVAAPSAAPTAPRPAC